MRKINATAEFARERNEFLLRAFRESIAAQSQISINNAFKTAAETPAPRFWVSEARATAVLGKMLAGENPLDDMLPCKREMYMELFRRLEILIEENPGVKFSELVFRVVNEGAPSSYMSWHRARILIYEEKKRRGSKQGDIRERREYD